MFNKLIVIVLLCLLSVLATEEMFVSKNLRRHKKPTHKPTHHEPTASLSPTVPEHVTAVPTYSADEDEYIAGIYYGKSKFDYIQATYDSGLEKENDLYHAKMNKLVAEYYENLARNLRNKTRTNSPL